MAWFGGHDRELDWHAVRVLAVVLLKCIARVMMVVVGDESGACAAVVAVVLNLDREDWANALEELLQSYQTEDAYVSAGLEHTRRSSSVRS